MLTGSARMTVSRWRAHLFLLLSARCVAWVVAYSCVRLFAYLFGCLHVCLLIFCRCVRFAVAVACVRRFSVLQISTRLFREPLPDPSHPSTSSCGVLKALDFCQSVHCLHGLVEGQTSKETNDKNKQTNKQTHKQASKQTNTQNIKASRQTNKHTKKNEQTNTSDQAVKLTNNQSN